MTTETFDSRSAGTSEDAWEQWISQLPTLTMPEHVDHMLVLVAHPDDEALGAGGLLSTAKSCGVEVTVIVASDGEASHPHSPSHTARQLAARRRAECAEGLAQLHPAAEVTFLGLPDSGLSAHADQLAQRVRLHLRGSSLVATPWRYDRHPDHAACARAGDLGAREVGIEHWQFPIWGWHWGDPQSKEFACTELRRFDLDDVAVEAKGRAVAAHRSQHSALSPETGDEPVLSSSMMEHFQRGCEVFSVTRPFPASQPGYFDELYADVPDPWGLSERHYERRKREILLSSLPRERFRRAFEPGCAIGLLTLDLAQRCDEVVAMDTAQAAVDQALARLAGVATRGRVYVARATIPENWPDGVFDLIVMSEIGYYCLDQVELTRRIDRSLAADGVLVACHWRHEAADHPVRAEEVHALMGHGLHNVVCHREGDFLLDVWTRDGMSVAAAEGIV